MMKIMGVDPSLRRSGWAVVEDGALLMFGAVVVPSKLRGDDATTALAMGIRRLVDRHSLDPDLLVVERQYVGASARSSLSVSMAAGVWIGAIQPRKLVMVYPSTWGAAFSLPQKSADRKEASKMIAQSIQGLPDGWTADEADAFLIALWAGRMVK